MNAVLYARANPTSANVDAVINLQLNVCREYAAGRGIVIVGEFIDRAAGNNLNTCPGFDKVMNMLTTGEAEVVIVRNLDRLGRNQATLAHSMKPEQIIAIEN